MDFLGGFLRRITRDRAFLIVAQHLLCSTSEHLMMYIGGMGGTGKSQMLKALTVFSPRCQESGRLICVALTGMAASIIKGSTYHFTFGINVFSPILSCKWPVCIQ
ncbi:hypothetical protein IW262DRAFT_1277200 [Armillaria fumosa]|nr:hypothetical protein IW262DRAFT_1277200 [Armillaria fumosa]